MKEITRIHLAALPYNCEVEAKKELEIYLTAIEQSLGADSDAMREIESRIAEILGEHGVSGEKVVTMADVEMVKTQLGNPEDFADEDATDSVVPAGTNGPRKRLMRDVQKGMISGVSAGLAAYFGIDVAWVRLLMVVLTFVTGGAMIPIYIVAWIVMPRAETAADRLLMAGQPVTLASLQTESAELPTQGNGKLLLTIVRWLTGLSVAGLGLVAFAAVAFLVVTNWQLVWYDQPSTYLPIALLMGVAGLSFVLSCWLVAYMLLAAKATKRMTTGLVIAVALGLATFTIAAGIMFVGARTASETFQKSFVTQRLETTVDLKETKAINVDARDVQVNYTVSSGAPYIETSYNSTVSRKPLTDITQKDGVLTIKAHPADKAECSRGFPAVGCVESSVVTIHGPVLERADIKGSFSYQPTSQAQFELALGERSSFVVANGSIEKLIATAASDSNIDAAPARIGSVKLTGDGRITASFATVTDAEVTLPTTCARETNSDISFESAGAIAVNGQPWDKESDIPCLKITETRGDQERRQ